MYKKLVVLLGTVAVVAATQAAVTISLGVGNLYGSSTATAFPDSGLIQLVASTSNTTFSSPTAGSFVSGDDVVLANFAMDSSTTGSPGFMLTALGLNYSGSVAAGESLLVRWFPTLTLASVASGPSAGTIFGQFRTDSVIDGSSSAWVLPADGQTVTLNFLTTSLGGSNAETLGLSSLMVTAVPEPSTYAAILGFATLGLVGYRRFRRR